MSHVCSCWLCSVSIHDLLDSNAFEQASLDTSCVYNEVTMCSSFLRVSCPGPQKKFTAAFEIDSSRLQLIRADSAWPTLKQPNIPHGRRLQTVTHLWHMAGGYKQSHICGFSNKRQSSPCTNFCATPAVDKRSLAS